MLRVVPKRDDDTSKPERIEKHPDSVSPYLQRTRRSYEEALRDRERRRSLERRLKRDLPSDDDESGSLSQEDDNGGE